MGGGCFRATASEGDDSVEPLVISSGYGSDLQNGEFAQDPALEAVLRPVLRAASRVVAPTHDEVLRLLAAAGDPTRSGAWLASWSARAQPKQRVALLGMLQKALNKALISRVERLERLVQGMSGERGAEMVAQLGQLMIAAKEDGFAIPEGQQPGVRAIAACLEHAAKLPSGHGVSLDESPGSFLIPALDRLVAVFRFALIRHISESVSNLQRWYDFEEEVGLPALAEHLALLSSSSKSVLLGMRLLPEGQRAVTVVTRRDQALQDAVGQFPAQGAAVLSPYFESSAGTKRVNGKLVEGGEGHGLRKEFFILASAAALERAPVPLFEFHRGSGQYFFSGYANGLDGPNGQKLAESYHCFGKLIALALCNHCRLSISLPQIFFRLLLRPEQRPQLEDLVGFDEALRTSMVKCFKMKDDQFRGMLDVEQLPPTTSRAEYVNTQVAEVLDPQAMRHLREGFTTIVGSLPLHGVAVADLRQIVCPLPKSRCQEFRKVFQVVVEDELSATPFLMKAFWAVVDAFTAEEKRKLLVFLTGLDTWPEPGMERITISSPFSAFTEEEHAEMLRMLPQAHTCANTLELPNYYAALTETRRDLSSAAIDGQLRSIVADRLRIAISESGGYDLDATDGEAVGLLVPSRDAASEGPVPTPVVLASPATSSSVMTVPDVRASSASTCSILTVVNNGSSAIPLPTPSGLGDFVPDTPSSIALVSNTAGSSSHAATAERTDDVDSFLASMERLTQEKFDTGKPKDDPRSIDALMEELEAAVLE